MPLVDAVCDEIVHVFKSNQQRIALCSAHRISCEGWFKVECLWRLDEIFSSDAPSTACEANYIDLTVHRGDERVLIELKTFPTNYGAPGKPITNFIDGVITDLQKLKPRCDGHTVGIAVWIAYPIPVPEPSTWATHLHRVNQAGATLRTEKIAVWENNYAHLYITQCRSAGVAAAHSN